ncbi:hypothetical protein [uncultured Enterovirga sp.]|uniref:hypothetical protein n=1 Tax=uncultured Enterovirga sp. TaxID=2026352 RepID=UPI0035CB1029
MPNPSRRGLLAGIAAASVSTVPTIVSAATNADAALIANCEETIRLHGQVNALCQRARLLREQNPTPPPPEALFRRNSDGSLFWGFVGLMREEDGRYWYGDWSSIRRLQTERFTNNMVTFKGDEAIQYEVRDDAAHDRSDEIVAAFDQWEADIEAAAVACGAAALEAEADRLSDAQREKSAAIRSAAATTIAGLTAKARYVLATTGPVDTWHADGVPTAMEGLMRDLLAIGEAA